MLKHSLLMGGAAFSLWSFAHFSPDDAGGAGGSDAVPSVADNASSATDTATVLFGGDTSTETPAVEAITPKVRPNGRSTKTMLLSRKQKTPPPRQSMTRRSPRKLIPLALTLFLLMASTNSPCPKVWKGSRSITNSLLPCLHSCREILHSGPKLRNSATR